MAVGGAVLEDFVDFTKPSGRETWKKLLKENILSKGNYNCLE